VISRKLAQVFFLHPNQITWSAIYDRMYHDHRWYLQHQLSLRLPLLAAVGISNSNSTFPLAFCYCQSESEEALGFFFGSLKEVVFLKGANQRVHVGILKVVLGRPSCGVGSRRCLSLPYTKPQTCDWHCRSNEKALSQRWLYIYPGRRHRRSYRSCRAVLELHSEWYV
jgi:hypothetical protein